MSVKGNWEIDTEKTQERIKKLEKYYNENLKNETEVCCKYDEACKKSQHEKGYKYRKISFASVGQFYDLSYKKVPIRVLIVGKEGTGDDSMFSKRKYANLCCIEWNRRDRNNHIRGTLETLEYIFAMTKEKEDNLYLAYTLSNGYKCAFLKHEGQRSGLQVTDSMKENCYKHLIEEIKILEPTLIIFQGVWAWEERLFYKLKDNFEIISDAESNSKSENAKYGMFVFKVNNHACHIIFSNHPSRLGVWRKTYAPITLWPDIDLYSQEKDFFLTDEDKNDLKELLSSGMNKLVEERNTLNVT